MQLEFKPLSENSWQDFLELFGKHGACGGCWCMHWRISGEEFLLNKGERNREAMHHLVQTGICPGLIAYHNHLPIGWCAVAPREEFPTLQRSRILAPVDEEKVWSVVCLFVTKAYRTKGVGTGLLRAAIEFVRSQGGKIIEGYPTKLENSKLPDPFIFTGLESMFKRVGFIEAIRRSPKRPVMRFFIN